MLNVFSSVVGSMNKRWEGVAHRHWGGSYARFVFVPGAR